MSERTQSILIGFVALLGIAMMASFCSPADALPKPASPVSIVRCNHV